MCLNLDNLECKINQPLPGTIAYWEKIKRIGGAGPKILPQDIVFIAVRDTEKPEEHLIKKYGIRNFTVAEVRQQGVAEICKQALAELTLCDHIYISFDVDSLDSSISVGTGTPVPNGLTVDEAMALNAQLIKDKRVCCWEIVEVNPTLDSENRMAEIGFDILESTTHMLVENF
jgi:arginase